MSDAATCPVTEMPGTSRRCQKPARHWGYVHEARDGFGLSTWCIAENGDWMWSSFVPDALAAEWAAEQAVSS